MTSPPASTAPPRVARIRLAPRRAALLALALVAIVAVVFGPVARYPFVKWDDDLNVYENPLLSPVTSASFVQAWTHASFHLYVPVTRTLWTAIAWASSRGAPVDAPLDPQPFHVANVVLHAANVLLVAGILLELLGAAAPACAGALLFALHPVQVEPVAWVTGAKDLLGAFFALLATLLWVRRARGAFVAFVLALLAKPTAAVLPAVLAFLDVAFLGRSLRETVRRLAAYFAAALAAVLVNAFVQPAPHGAVALWARPLVAADALVWYARQIVLPTRLAIDYGRSPGAVLASRVAWLAIPLVAALGFAVWRWRASFASKGAALTALAVAPSVGLVPYGFQDTSTVADRYLYVAMLGPALVLGGALRRWNGRAAWAAGISLLVALGVASVCARSPWRDSEALFRHAVEVNPRSRVGRYNLAMTLAERGRAADAAQELELLLRSAPDDALAHAALGKARAALGALDAAAAEFQRAIELDPGGAAAAYFDLGNCRTAQRRLPEAARAYRESLRLDPDAVSTHYNLALVLAASDDLEAAAAEFATVLQLDPSHESARVKLALVTEQKVRAAPSAAPTP